MQETADAIVTFLTVKRGEYRFTTTICSSSSFNTEQRLSTLGAAVKQVYNNAINEAAAHAASCSSALALFRLADEMLLEYQYDAIPKRWLQTYADAALLCVVPVMRQSRITGEDALAAIDKLDRTFIVVGRPDEEQADFTLSVIRALQTCLAAPSTFERMPKRAPPLDVQHDRRIQEYSIDTAPSFDDYLSVHVNTPFIIRSGSSHWPAIASWSDLNYLARLAGPGRVVPIEIGESYTASNWSQKILPFHTLLQSFSTSSADENELLYLAQYDLFAQFPDLRADVVPPNYVFSDPPAPEHFHAYVPPANGYIQNIWLGPAKTLSPAHTDPYYNAYSSFLLPLPYYDIRLIGWWNSSSVRV